MFADNLPSGVLIVTPDALSTNCPNPVTTTASSGVVSYPGWRSGTGQWLLHFCQLGFCRFGAEVNTILAGALVTAQGSNAVPATATLTVVAVASPSLSKAFSPVVMAPGATATLQIRLNNPDTIATSLSATLTVTLPTGMTIAAPPSLATSGCSLGSLAAKAGGNSVTYATGATLPAGGCTLTVNITAKSGVTTTYTNTLAIGSMQTAQAAMQQAPQPPWRSVAGHCCPSSKATLQAAF